MAHILHCVLYKIFGLLTITACEQVKANRHSYFSSRRNFVQFNQFCRQKKQKGAGGGCSLRSKLELILFWKKKKIVFYFKRMLLCIS
jgi:hypothetical protein